MTDTSAVRRPAAVEPLAAGAARMLTLWRLWRREKTDPLPFYTLLAAELAESLERRHGPLAGRVLLDLGCGPGAYTEALRARGAKVLAVDNDPAALAVGDVELAGAIIADAAALPLPDGSID